MPERALDAEVVVTEALALLDQVGLRGFTMRALAQRLHTYPASIYWHVGTRTDVLSAVNERVLRELWPALPDSDAPAWDEYLRALAVSYRRGMQRHPAVATWSVTHFEAGVPVPDLLEQLLGVLAGTGLEGEELAAAFSAFVGSVVGWTGLEMIAADPDVGSDPERFHTSMSSLSGDSYPHIVANLDHLADRSITFRWHGGATHPLDAAFDFALEMWIEGIRARVPHRR